MCVSLPPETVHRVESVESVQPAVPGHSPTGGAGGAAAPLHVPHPELGQIFVKAVSPAIIWRREGPLSRY